MSLSRKRSSTILGPEGDSLGLVAEVKDPRGPVASGAGTVRGRVGDVSPPGRSRPTQAGSTYVLLFVSRPNVTVRGSTRGASVRGQGEGTKKGTLPSRLTPKVSPSSFLLLYDRRRSPTQDGPLPDTRSGRTGGWGLPSGLSPKENDGPTDFNRLTGGSLERRGNGAELSRRRGESQGPSLGEGPWVARVTLDLLRGRSQSRRGTLSVPGPYQD